MTVARKIHRRVWVLLLAGAVASTVAQPLWADGGGPAGSVVRIEQPLDWEHWGLTLRLDSAHRLGGRAALLFCLRLRPEVDSAWAEVGYPRYRLTSGRWADAVTRGNLDRERVARAARSDGTAPFCFAVMVPYDARTLLLPLENQDVRIELGPWFERLERAPGPVQASRPPALPPGSPVRLESRVRWEGDLPFSDGALDAGEAGELLVDVTNSGERATRDVRLRVTSLEPTEIVLPDELRVDRLAPHETRTVRVPLRGGEGLNDALVRLRVEVFERDGHDAPPVEVELVTRSLPQAELVVLDDFAIEGASLPVPRDTVVTVRLRVRNVGRGTARAVAAEISTGEGTFRADGPSAFELGSLESGGVAELAFRCYANQRASALELNVWLSEARGSSAASLVRLPLDRAAGPAQVVRVRAEPRAAAELAPPPPPLTSDVDLAVERSATSRPNALAVVFGVERYASAPPALHAADDARTARLYFERTLGVPPERIQLLVDREVTYTQFNRVFGTDGWLARRAEPGSEVFVFFAGHGMTTVEDGSLWLMPADADPAYVRETGFPIERLLERLAGLEAERATVFLDTCFSGLGRSGESLLASGRPLVVAPSHTGPPGVSIWSAAHGAQVAHALGEQGHGLFTYWLFKGLGGAADLDGDASILAGELKVWLEDSVPRSAAREGWEQHPAIFLDDPEAQLVELP